MVTKENVLMSEDLSMSAQDPIPEPNREDPDYIDAVIAKKPHGDDPKDIRIRNLIAENFLREEWARAAFDNIKTEQLGYLRDVIAHVDDPAYVDRSTQDVLRHISAELRSTIEEGSEKLDAIPPNTPTMLMTNHLGTYKLAGINPQTDLGDGVDIYSGYDFMYPYPLYFAGLYPVADKIGGHLSYTSDDFPGVFGKIHTEAGFIHVPPAALIQGGRTELLKHQTGRVIQEKPNTALVNFPEGGTSGKYNEAGPYDLLDFKTGGYVIAAELGITVIPVAQYFDPEHGMRLKVFDPFVPEATTREGYQEMANATHREMQEWLKAKEQSQA